MIHQATQQVQRRGILRPVAQQAVDGYKGVRYHRQAVDQAAAGVVAGALMLRVPQIPSAVYAAHKGAQERHRHQRYCVGGPVGGLRHLGGEPFHVVIEQSADVLQYLQRFPLALGADGLAGDGGYTAGQGQLQNLAQIQPAVGGVAVVLAHD